MSARPGSSPLVFEADRPGAEVETEDRRVARTAVGRCAASPADRHARLGLRADRPVAIVPVDAVRSGTAAVAVHRAGAALGHARGRTAVGQAIARPHHTTAARITAVGGRAAQVAGDHATAEPGDVARVVRTIGVAALTVLSAAGVAVGEARLGPAVGDPRIGDRPVDATGAHVAAVGGVVALGACCQAATEGVVGHRIVAAPSGAAAGVELAGGIVGQTAAELSAGAGAVVAALTVAAVGVRLARLEVEAAAAGLDPGSVVHAPPASAAVGVGIAGLVDIAAAAGQGAGAVVDTLATATFAIAGARQTVGGTATDFLAAMIEAIGPGLTTGGRIATTRRERAQRTVRQAATARRAGATAVVETLATAATAGIGADDAVGQAAAELVACTGTVVVAVAAAAVDVVSTAHAVGHAAAEEATLAVVGTLTAATVAVVGAGEAVENAAAAGGTGTVIGALAVAAFAIAGTDPTVGHTGRIAAAVEVAAVGDRPRLTHAIATAVGKLAGRLVGQTTAEAGASAGAVVAAVAFATIGVADADLTPPP